MNSVPPWLAGARTAPSALNTQPWLFHPLPDGAIQVRWDPDRTRPVGDPDVRDLFLSLGAAVESARLAAAAAGTPLTFEPVEGEPCVAGTLRPSDEQPAPDDLVLAQQLERRHTARGPYRKVSVPATVIERMVREAEAAQCRLHVVTDRVRIVQLARLARMSTAKQFEIAPLQHEIYRWLRLNRSDPAYARDGVTADTLRLRGPGLLLARLTLPAARMRALVRLGLHHVMAVDAERIARRTPAMCLLTAPSAAPADLLRAGAALLRVWLIASEANLATHPLGTILDSKLTVRAALRIFEAEKEAACNLFRMGVSEAAARAPRLPIEELLAKR